MSDMTKIVIERGEAKDRTTSEARPIAPRQEGRMDRQTAEWKAEQYDSIVRNLKVADGGRYRADTEESILIALRKKDAEIARLRALLCSAVEMLTYEYSNGDGVPEKFCATWELLLDFMGHGKDECREVP